MNRVLKQRHTTPKRKKQRLKMDRKNSDKLKIQRQEKTITSCLVCTHAKERKAEFHYCSPLFRLLRVCYSKWKKLWNFAFHLIVQKFSLARVMETVEGKEEERKMSNLPSGYFWCALQSFYSFLDSAPAPSCLLLCSFTIPRETNQRETRLTSQDREQSRRKRVETERDRDRRAGFSRHLSPKFVAEGVQQRETPTSSSVSVLSFSKQNNKTEGE